LITQTDEWADEEHLPSFGIRAEVYGLNAEEAAEAAKEAEAVASARDAEIRERELRHFTHDVLGNSSTPVTGDEDYQTGIHTVIMRPGMSVVEDDFERPDPLGEESQPQEEIPASVAPYAWSSTWARARAEAAQRQVEEERFSWMKEADLQMLSLGLEPVPWEHFAGAISQTGETQFQAIEQRTCGEQVLESGGQPGPDSWVGATLVVRSITVITVLRMVSHGWNAPGATAKMLSMMAETLPMGA
jgi:hypothetical protein